MLKKFMNRRKESSVRPMADVHSYLYKALFAFLIQRISIPRNAEQLIQLAHKSVRKAEDAFHAYLLFEKYLTSFEEVERYTRESLRESIRQRFPALLQEPIFNLLFLSETEQKNTLALQFLQAFLKAVGDKFGRAGEGYFEKKRG